MKKSSMGRKAPFKSSKKFEYSITYSFYDEESLEMGESFDSGYEVEPEVESISEILYTAWGKYGIYYPVSIGTWEATDVPEDRDFYEKGIRKYYFLHLKNEDGTEISEEDNDFVTHILSNGEYNREYFEEFALGGFLDDSTNEGLSWKLDRAKFNKGESYEIPMSRRKAMGGDADERELIQLRINNLKSLVNVMSDDEEIAEMQGVIARLERERDAMKYAGGGEIEWNYWKIEKDDEIIYERTNVASPNIPNGKRISKEEYDYNVKKSYKTGGEVYFNGMSKKEILDATVVFDNNGDTLDRYTVFTPDGSVFGMSENASGFNQYIGEDDEVEQGEHLGRKLKSVPKGIQWAVLDRMKEEYKDGGRVDLFEDYENIPENIQSILDKYSDDFEEGNYSGLQKAQKEVEKEGYTFDFYLDGSAFGLRPKGVSLNELEGYDNEYGRGGYLYEVNKEGENLELRDRLFSAKNVKQLKERIIEKFGSLKGITASRRMRGGYYASVKLSYGGEVFKVGDKVKIKYISDYSKHNDKVGTITFLKEYNYYPNGDYSVIEKKTQGTITYDDGSEEDVSDFYRKGSGLVSPVEKVKYADGGGVEGKLSYEEFVETLRDNDRINTYTGRTTTGMEMYYLPSGHPFLGMKFPHKNKRKAYNEYLKIGNKIGFDSGFNFLSMAEGGGVEGHKHVLHIDGQNWFLEKIDSTHFYMSNDRDFRGMAHHIGQHKGEPYYEEVREWLKSTYAEGGGVGNNFGEGAGARTLYELSLPELETQLKITNPNESERIALLEKLIEQKSNKYANGGGIYSSDEMYQLSVFDGKTNELLTTKRFRARNQREANEMGEEYESSMKNKYGDYLRFKVELAPSMMKDGGGVEYEDREDFYEKNPNFPRRIEITKKQYLKNKDFISKQKWARNIVDKNGYEDNNGVEFIEFDIEVGEKSSWDMWGWINENIPSSDKKIFVQDKRFLTYNDGGEVEEWMSDALKELRDYTDNNSLKIENVYDDDYFLASDGSEEYLVFEDFDEAHEYAVDDVKNNLEENPEYFQRDWLMGHISGETFFRNVYDEWNMGYATDIMTEDDDKYPNRLIAEMVQWGIMDSDEAKGSDAEEIANDRMEDFVNALTDDQINQGNDGFDYYIDNFGEEEAFKMALENNLIDIEGASEDAVSVDGVAHFISSYDGEEIALDGGSYAYRIN